MLLDLYVVADDWTAESDLERLADRDRADGGRVGSLSAVRRDKWSLRRWQIPVCPAGVRHW